MFFSQDVTENSTLAGSAGSPLLVCRDHSTPPLLGSQHGMGSLCFRASHADNFGLLARDANTCVYSARLIAGVQRAGLDAHDISFASGSVLGYEVSPASAYGCGRANGYHVLARSLRAVALAVGRWSSSMVTNLSWRSAIVVLSRSLMPASNLRGRPIWLLENHPWSTVRMEQIALGGILCLLPP